MRAERICGDPGAHPRPRRDRARDGPRGRRGRAPGAGRRRLRPDPVQRRLHLGARQREPGARGGRPLPAPGQGHRHGRLPRRPRHQGRRDRRPARARAHGRHGAAVRGRPLPLLPHAARRQEPLRLDQRAGRLRDDRRRPARRRRSVAPLPRRQRARPPGAAVHVAVEGSRCFVVEVQALVNRTELAMPRRVAVGFDRNRLAMLVAVLGRHARLPLSSSDIFVKIAGGIRIDEPAADLAVALAIASAERNVPLPPRVAAIGEISLTGELRSCSQSERRVAEAGRAGFERVVVPAADARRVGGISLWVRPICVAPSRTPSARVRRPAAAGATNDHGGFEYVVLSRRQGRVSASRCGQDHEDRAERSARSAARLPHHPDPAQRHDRHGPGRERRPRRPAQGRRGGRRRRRSSRSCAATPPRCPRTGAVATSTTATSSRPATSSRSPKSSATSPSATPTRVCRPARSRCSRRPRRSSPASSCTRATSAKTRPTPSSRTCSRTSTSMGLPVVDEPLEPVTVV